MARPFSATLTPLSIALTLACSSVSGSDPSFWEPSRDLGGREFGGFKPPGGSGGESGAVGSNTGGSSSPGGASGVGGASGSGNAGRGGTDGNSGTSGASGAGGDTGAGGEGGMGGGAGGNGGSGAVGGGTGGGTGGGGSGTGGVGGVGGVGGSGPSTTCTLTVDFTTVTYRGRFGPKNIGAVWVTNQQDQFVKTLEVWAGIRANNLVNWQRVARANKVDAVSSATISNHRAHQARWDCRDATGNVVPNGQYKMFVEFTEDDSALFFNPQPKLFSFDFKKGGGPEKVTPPSQTNFTGVALSIQ